MALVPCQNCKREISDYAPSCPYCDAAISQKISAAYPSGSHGLAYSLGRVVRDIPTPARWLLLIVVALGIFSLGIPSHRDHPVAVETKPAIDTPAPDVATAVTAPSETNSSASAWQNKPGITDHALAVCRALTNSGATECELTVFSQAIDVRVNVSAADAPILCKGIVELVRKQTTAFSGSEWQIRVFSPFSGDHPLAACSLS
jgi:hypothetical protein